VTIGEWAMIGAGSVITRDVSAYTLVAGNPAKFRGFVCPCGASVDESGKCANCGFQIPDEVLDRSIAGAALSP
jgi:hypothetical protein